MQSFAPRRLTDGTNVTNMTHDHIRELIAATGRGRRELARMLGYRSENSLRQAEAGKRTISDAEVKWLERYARLRTRLATMEAAWLEKNPPPDRRGRL
jgi:hypothetical protein